MSAAKLSYFVLAAAILFFFSALSSPKLLYLGFGIDLVWLLAIIIDFYLTAPAKLISAQRAVAERLSIGRRNEVLIEVFCQASHSVRICLRDAFPQKLQADVREFQFAAAAASKVRLEYSLLPRQRGAYEFGDISLRYRSRLGLFWRHVRIAAK